MYSLNYVLFHVSWTSFHIDTYFIFLALHRIFKTFLGKKFFFIEIQCKEKSTLFNNFYKVKTHMQPPSRLSSRTVLVTVVVFLILPSVINLPPNHS